MSTSVLVHDAQLEASIAQAPHELSRWSVYADWLQHHGDPRGEVLALALAAQAEVRPLARRRLDAQVPPARALLLPELLGAAQAHASQWAEKWLGPFLTQVQFDVQRDRPDALVALLQAPASRLLQQLEVRYTTYQPIDFAPLVAQLAAAGPASLRGLSLGLGFEGAAHHDTYGEVGALVQALPNLEVLRLGPGEARLGPLDFPALHTLVLKRTGSSAGIAEALGASQPRLRVLQVAGAQWSALEEPLLTRARPRLERLGLDVLEADAAAAALADSPLATQLRALTLKGPLSDAGLSRLVAARGRFPQLERLEVEGGHLSALAALEAQQKAGIVVLERAP